MNKYIIIKLPGNISLVDQLKTMELLDACNLNYQWYNQGFSTDKDLFVSTCGNDACKCDATEGDARTSQH